MAITRVDAKYIPNGEILIGSLDDPDLIAGSQLTFDDDSQIGPGPQSLGEAAQEQLVIHPNSKSPAGDSRLGNLENGGSNFPTLSDERIVQLDPFGGEILAKLAVGERSADLPFPPPYVFDGVRVDCFIGSPVCLAIGLVVSSEV